MEWVGSGMVSYGMVCNVRYDNACMVWYVMLCYVM